MTLFSISAFGAALATLYLKNTTDIFNRLIQLRQMETDQRNLFLAFQAAQTDLSLPYPNRIRTRYPKKDHLVSLMQAAEACSTCHHGPESAYRIEHIQSQIVVYRDAFDFVVKANNSMKLSDQARLHELAIGIESLSTLEDMFMQTSTKLGSITREAKRGITLVWLTLAGTVIILLVFSIVVVRKFFVVFTRPINTLVHATRMIASGNLGYAIDFQDKTEFGERASYFNTMSLSLKNG